jgi:hypothetical protein
VRQFFVSVIRRDDTLCPSWQRATRSNRLDACNATPFDDYSTRRDLVSGLVRGVIDDVRSAVGASVDSLRGEIDERLGMIVVTLRPLLIAIGLLIVVGIAFALTIAASLVALGVPLLVAAWGVTLALAALGVGAVRRARPRALSPAASEAALPQATEAT